MFPFIAPHCPVTLREDELSGKPTVWISLGRSARDFHLVKNMVSFPLLVLKGTYHYWTFFPGGAKANGGGGEFFVFFAAGCEVLPLVPGSKQGDLPGAGFCADGSSLPSRQSCNSKPETGQMFISLSCSVAPFFPSFWVTAPLKMVFPKKGSLFLQGH